MQHSYDSRFMDYADRSSRYSAHTVSSLLRQVLPIASVLDVGCARGTWLSAWRESGAQDIMGVDGNYVDRSTLVIPSDRFVAVDLAQRFDLARTFDLVQSLEVAEHIPSPAADQFVENLTRHCTGIVLFSAAPPGQGGEFHVNEQSYEYWRKKFSAQGFEAYDFVRPQIANDKSVSFWYRFNTILYVRQDVGSRLPDAIMKTHVPVTQPIRELAPPWFRARKLLVRAMPDSVQQALARLKAHVSEALGRRA